MSHQLTELRVRSRWIPSRWTVFAVTMYIAVGIFANYHAIFGGINHTLNGGVGGDGGQDLWFLAVVAHELAHLNFSFFSATVNIPRGVDLANMTSMPLLGVLGAPITWLVGPIATYNFLISFCYTTAGSAMYFTARRFTKWEGAALLAGLLYACSPYMIGEGKGHIFLVLSALFPLWVLVLDEILIRQRWHWAISGVALFAVVCGQVFIAVEPAVSALMLSVAVLLVLILFFKKLRSEKTPYAIRSIGFGSLLSSPFLVWFAYEYFLGKGHGKGTVRSPLSVTNLSSDVVSFFTPGSNQFFHFGFAHFADSLVNFGITTIVPDPPENAAYIGIPLLLLLSAGIYWLRRKPRVLVFTGLGLLSMLLSMGSQLRIGGHSTAIPLPFWIFAHLPVLDSTIAIRWNIFSWVFISLIAAIIVDQVYEVVKRERTQKNIQLGIATTALVGLSLFSLIPALPYGASTAAVPAWFTSPQQKTISSDSVLISYPLAYGGSPLPMLWQAVDKFHFHLVGGEVGSQAVSLGATREALDSCLTSASLSSNMQALIPQIRKQFIKWGVTIAVLPIGYAPNQNCAASLFSAVTGKQPVTSGGSLVWSNFSITAS